MGVSFRSCNSHKVKAVILLSMRRNEMKEILQPQTSGVSRPQYIRLMLLGMANISLWFPLTLAFTGINLTGTPIFSYTSWSLIHSNFNTVLFYDSSEIPTSDMVIFELSRWMGPIIAVFVFLFFGFKQEVWEPFTSLFKSVFRLQSKETPETSLEYGTEGERPKSFEAAHEPGNTMDRSEFQSWTSLSTELLNTATSLEAMDAISTEKNE